MRVLAGSFVAVALLLGLGGGFELWRPAATVGAMRAMGLPSSAPVVRLGGLAAMMLSVGAVVSLGRPFAAAVSAVYVALAGFVLAALVRRVPLKTCGCFGRDDTPPTIGHLVVDTGAAVVAGLVAFAPGARKWTSVHLDANAWVVSLFVILSASVAAFAWLALTALPRLTTDGSTPTTSP